MDEKIVREIDLRAVGISGEQRVAELQAQIAEEIRFLLTHPIVPSEFKDFLKKSAQKLDRLMAENPAGGSANLPK